MEYQYFQDWNYDKNNYRKFINVTKEDIEQFINEMNEAEFVDMTGTDVYDSLKKKIAHLYFRMKDGTTIKLILLEDGYISYANLHKNILLKLESETFKKIFEEATPENYVFPTGK